MSNEKKAWTTPRVRQFVNPDALIDHFQARGLNPAEQGQVERLAMEMRRCARRAAA